MMLVLGLSAREAKSMDEIYISPNPMLKLTTIYLNFDSPISVNVNVINEHGINIKNIYSGYCGKQSSFIWERDDNQGNFVPSGTYYVTVSSNSRYTSIKKTLILK